MPIIQKDMELKQSLDLLALVLRHFMASTTNDQQKQHIGFILDWYSKRPEVVLDLRFETFPELGMLGRLTIELKPQMTKQ